MAALPMGACKSCLSAASDPGNTEKNMMLYCRPQSTANQPACESWQ